MKISKLIEVLEGILEADGDQDALIESSFNEYDSRPVKDVYMNSDGVEISAG
tara:strand:- start:3253 stop:3408 length:156 start_codon:yes stop_codon:yes gene_type:complete